MKNKPENNEEALYHALVSTIERYDMLMRQRMVYDDLTDYEDELLTGDIPKGKARIIRDNFIQYMQLHVESLESITMVICIYDIFKKLFPNSEALRDSELERTMNPVKDNAKSSKETLNRVIRTGIENFFKNRV